MKDLRILFAVTNDLVYDRRMDRICTALAEAGASVTLVGRKRKQSADFQPVKFKGVRLTCWCKRGFLFYAEYNLRLFFFLLRQQADVLCACDLDTALPVILVSKIKGRRSVYDAHEYFTAVPELSNRPFVRGVWEWIARRTIHRFDLRYTVGEELADLMGKKYDCAFEVIRNIAPAATTPVAIVPFAQRKNVILYQGAINVGRGLDTAIKSMAHLPGWELWLAGQGDIDDYLVRLAKAEGVSDRVKFLGWVKPDQLPVLLQQAKVNLNLRETGSLNDYYSLPNKFFDAIHAGLPSIHMNYPEYRRIIDRYPCAVLIDTVDVDTVVAAVRQLDNAASLTEMAAACDAAAREFTWAKEAERLVRIYKNR